jgi:hypothetical protein
MRQSVLNNACTARWTSAADAKVGSKQAKAFDFLPREVTGHDDAQVIGPSLFTRLSVAISIHCQMSASVSLQRQCSKGAAITA